MTDFEHIFFDPGHDSPGIAAEVLADRLGMEHTMRSARHGVGHDWTDAYGRHSLGGEVLTNIFGADHTDESGEFSIMDPFPLVWSLTVRPAPDRDTPQRAALHIVEKMIAADLGWALALVTGFDWAVAAFDGVRGLRVFPPRTSPDEDGADVWR